MLPLITLDIRTSRSTPDGDAYNYYNRYDYDVKLLTDDDQEIFIGKGSSVLYLCEKAINEGFDILWAFDDNHHEEIYNLLYDEDGDLKDEWEYLFAENESFNSTYSYPTVLKFFQSISIMVMENLSATFCAISSLAAME